jgi:hypothetical protein
MNIKGKFVKLSFAILGFVGFVFLLILLALVIAYFRVYDYSFVSDEQKCKLLFGKSGMNISYPKLLFEQDIFGGGAFSATFHADQPLIRKIAEENNFIRCNPDAGPLGWSINEVNRLIDPKFRDGNSINSNTVCFFWLCEDSGAKLYYYNNSSTATFFARGKYLRRNGKTNIAKLYCK